MKSPEVSIVIPVHNEGERLKLTLDSLANTMLGPYEVIVVDDESTDGCCESIGMRDAVRVLRPPHRMGVSGTRNFGAKHAVAPMILFLDGHCYPAPGWFERCRDALRRLGRGIVGPCVTVAGNPAARGYGMAVQGLHLSPQWLDRQRDVPYPVPMLAGCCILMYRSFFEMIGGFDDMRIYGVEDSEICVRSWLLGYPVLVVPRAEVAHVFKEQSNFHVPWEAYIFNALRMAILHFEGEVLARIIGYWEKCPGYEAAWSAVQESDVWQRRDALHKTRAHDADWYCRKFSIEI